MTEIYFLVVMEAGSPRSECRHGPDLVTAVSGLDGSPSRCALTPWGETPVVSSYKDTDHSDQVPILPTHSTLLLPSSKCILRGIMASAYEFREMRFSP